MFILFVVVYSFILVALGALVLSYPLVGSVMILALVAAFAYMFRDNGGIIYEECEYDTEVMDDSEPS